MRLDKRRLAYLKFKHQKGEALRYRYDLRPDSVVIDVGGYLGDFTSTILDKFNPRVFIFEPHPDFNVALNQRFEKCEKVTVINAALGNESGTRFLVDDADATFLGPKGSRVGGTKLPSPIQMIDVFEFFNLYDIKEVDLMKINIEGGEYDLLQRMLDQGIHLRVKNFQVQFHDFYPNSLNLRMKIRSRLSASHMVDWEYFFVWESWSRK